MKIHTTEILDINECLLRNGHGPCQDTCGNTFGGYNCTCNGLPGTRLREDRHTCEDAGECSNKNGGCSHICLTNMGRVYCLCPSGFVLGDDWQTCKGNLKPKIIFIKNHFFCNTPTIEEEDKMIENSNKRLAHLY